MMQIGFIGLGRMGLPMCVSLVRAGYQVTGVELLAVALLEEQAGVRLRQGPA
jgi:3-hydroxyisobutyrate dehydrogenase-like beta-hydroxyacid dehydrogenase